MSLLDDAKDKLEEARDAAKDASDKISEKADIAKQHIEGEADKAKGDDLKGETKIKASEVRNKLS